MQKLLLLFLIISFNQLKAQTYTPFPDSGAVWVNVVEYYEMGEDIMEVVATYADNFCANGEDTLINSLSYAKINYCGGNYYGALRDNGGQVFFVPKDSLNEFLLYDFLVQENDTLFNVYTQMGLFDELVIDNVDSIQIGTEYRTRISTGGGEWIEGIGCTQGLFHWPCPNVSGWIESLHCMTYHDTIMYPDYYYGAGQCALDVNIKENDEKFNASVFPNPTNGFFEIQGMTLKTNSSIIIFDAFGQTFNPEIITSENLVNVNLNEYPNGIYFVTIVNDAQFHTLKIVKQ